MPTQFYFAFGSNMLTERLRARCPSARALGLGVLPGWRLAFHKRSRDGSSKADIEPAADEGQVIGVVFELDAADLKALDLAEGRGHGYESYAMNVELNGRSVACLAYTAVPRYIDAKLRPYAWYRQLVLAGLVEHGAPEDYIATVAAVPAVPDPDPERRERREALTALAAFREKHPELAAALGAQDDA